MREAQQQPERLPRKLFWAAGLFTLWVAMMWNGRNEVLRFDSPTLNAGCLLIAYSLPWFSMVLASSGSRGWTRVTAVGILALPMFFSAIFALFVLMHLGNVHADGDIDASYEFLAAVPVEGGRVAIYRTNCGATCAFGIAVRQERRLFWRLLLVRHLGGFYRADEATYEALNPRRVRVSVPPYVATPGSPTRSDVYEIKPWLYF
jgi:hypothetical protein